MDVLENIKDIPFYTLKEKYDKMIWKLSKKFKKSTNTNFSLDELYQFGLFGLWRASVGYELDKGTRFSTYAYITIAGHIRNGINKEKEVDLTRAEVKRKEEVANLLWMKEENGWSWEETREYSGLSIEEWNDAIELNKSTISIYTDVNRCNSDEEQQLIEYLPGELGIEEKVIAKDTISNLISDLDELEIEMIRFRFIEGYNKTETSQILQIPSSSYHRKEKKLLKKIKEQKRPTLA